MNALETIRNHRSIRKYKNEAVSKEVLDNILEAAFRTSTTGNMQVYSIIVTQDKEKREALHKLHFGQDMVLEAPLLLTFNADFNRFNKWCEQRKAEPGYDNFLSFFTASIDALLAAQNAAIAAEAQGLGVCYLGTTTYQAGKLVDFFKLPKGVVPVTTLVIGYPNETPNLVDRLPARGIVHYEEYQDYSEADIDQVYAEKEALQETKDLLKENNLETLAQIFTQNRYPKQMNVDFSKLFLEVIKNQGFMNQ
ncbi:MAG: NADPH-dependent oxidoreductase [Bacteroidetes bacterium]|nr:MAG: NADPH-dependent oxidoreductase [Bacteroidota bacterium]